MTTLIRPEQPADVAHVHAVNEQAFGQPLEADLVDALRRNCPDALSLVAVDDDGTIVGHILFTPVTLAGGGDEISGMGLAPMAVLPDRQRQGIGTALVQRGIETLAARGCPFVIVVGHPEYYPRLGFERASLHGIRCQWDSVPDEAVMIRVLDPATMASRSGVARYRDELDAAV